MRILQVIEFFTPGMGGSAQVAYQTARHLARRGHQVTVCTSDHGCREGAFLDQSFQVHYFTSLPTRWKFYITPGLLPWAWRHLGEYNIIHLHDLRTFQNAVIGAVARRKGVPYVISAHGSLPFLAHHAAVKHGFDLLFGDRLIAGARQMIAVSEVEAEQFEQAGIPSRKIVWIPNGLDLDEFSSLPPHNTFRSKHYIPVGAKVILFLGRIHPIKGLDHLITAFASLSRSQADVWLVIAGPDDGDLSRLQGLARQIPTGERVLFPGPLYGNDKLAALVDADVLAFPSSYEIFGLVPFEALMCGTPVVTSQESATGQIIERAGAGYTAPHSDVGALEASLRRVLTRPDRAAEMVKAGQSFIHQQLDWRAIARKIEEVYSSALPGIRQTKAA